jgi:hypothetical protein
MAKKITIDTNDALSLITMFKETLEKGMPTSNEDEAPVSGLAAYMLNKYCDYDITDRSGTPIQKSQLDEITLDFTRGRTLSEKEAEIAINYIYDTNPYLSLFNTRVVKSLVTEVEGRAITQKNFISNEQNGGAVTTVNRRIVHNFGVNLFLRHAQTQKDIPLQTVIDNLHNPGWEQSVLNDVATAIGNDILLLALNGLGGTYSSSQDFYDLNLGFNKMLQIADGVNTNTYGNIKVKGFLGVYLTPQKIDITGQVGTSYNAANMIVILRKMYNAMPKKYRDNPRNVFMMSQADVDLYVESRTDLGSGGNAVREGVLNTGVTPNFMGHNLVAIPGWIGINETHESQSTLNGSIVFGDPKNLDVATDSITYRKSMQYNARGDYGPAFEYTYDLNLDFQAAKPESFVIAFKGAKVSDPILLTADQSKNGISGYDPAATLAVTGAGTGGKFHMCCANSGAVMVRCNTTLAGKATLTDAINTSTAVVIPQNGQVTWATGTAFYVRAYHPNMIPSNMVTVTITA